MDDFALDQFADVCGELIFFMGEISRNIQDFSKRVLTSNGKACNIIQVADEHGNVLQQETLMGKPSGGLTTKELLKNFFKKVLDKINVLRYYIEAVSSKQH